MDATPRTTLRDAVLEQITHDLNADAVAGVEWAAMDDTAVAVLRRHHILDFDEYMAAAEVLA